MANISSLMFSNSGSSIEKSSVAFLHVALVLGLLLLRRFYCFFQAFPIFYFSRHQKNLGQVGLSLLYLPSMSLMSRLTPADMSWLIILWLLDRAAMWSAVCPSWFCRSRSTPTSSSRLTVLYWLSWQARWSAEYPLEFCAFVLTYRIKHHNLIVSLPFL